MVKERGSCVVGMLADTLRHQGKGDRRRSLLKQLESCLVGMRLAFCVVEEVSCLVVEILVPMRA